MGHDITGMRRGRKSSYKVLRHLIRRFHRLQGDQKRLHLEAVFELYFARCRVLLTPVSRYSKGWGGLDEKARGTGDISSTPLVNDVSRAVTVMARYLPGKLVCLPQAMAAQRMLRRRGISSTLFLGVRRSDTTSLEAHAWLESSGRQVTGMDGMKDIVCLAAFNNGSTK